MASDMPRSVAAHLLEWPYPGSSYVRTSTSSDALRCSHRSRHPPMSTELPWLNSTSTRDESSFLYS